MSLKAEQLAFSYGQKNVLENISFEVKQGELLSVLGANGVGKSTLFRCMLGILKPTKGAVFFENTDISQMQPEELAKKIAYIPQSHSPVFNFSVLDMVLMGTTAQMGRFSSPKQQQIQIAKQALQRLGIEHLQNRGYANISGGERQMTLIARAIAQQAKILVMDEPSSSLDFGNKVRLMETVRGLTEEGYAVIQSTHDPEQAYLYSGCILALHKGKIFAYGKPSKVLNAATVSEIYGTEIMVHSLHGDKARVCVPAGVDTKTGKNKENETK